MIAFICTHTTNISNKDVFEDEIDVVKKGREKQYQNFNQKKHYTKKWFQKSNKKWYQKFKQKWHQISKQKWHHQKNTHKIK